MRSFNIKINDFLYTEKDFRNLLNLKISGLEKVINGIVAFLEVWQDNNKYVSVKTSGSTGKPKVIKHKKESLWQSAKMTCEFFGLNNNHNALLCVPVDFIAGKMMIIRSIYAGFNLIITEPKSDPFKGINNEIDFVAITPFQLLKSLKSVSNKKIRNIIVGGASVSEDLQNKILKIPAAVYETFGMTETCSHIALKKINGSDKTDYFKVLSGVSISVDNRDCLNIKVPNIVKKTIVTNDFVELKGKSEFKWLGRFDNIINTGGIKINPEQLERKIRNLLSVNYFITGLPDPYLGQKIVLVLECQKMSEEWERDIIEKIRKKTLRFEAPKEILYVEKIDRTENGKVKRLI